MTKNSKRFLFPAVWMILAVILTGCGKPTMIGIAKDTAKAIDNLQSVKGTLDLDLQGSVSIPEIEGLNSALNMSINMDYEAMSKPDPASYMKGTISAAALSLNYDMDTEIYSIPSDEDVTTYASFQDHWIKNTINDGDEKSDDKSGVVNKKLFQAIAARKLKATLDEKTHKVNDKDAYLITVTLPAAELQSYLSGTNNIADNLLRDVDLSDISIKARFYIDKQTSRPAKLTMDIGDLANAVISSSKSDSVSMDVKKLALSITFDSYNQVKEIKVPEKVVSSANTTDDVMNQIIGSMKDGGSDDSGLN